MRIFVFGNPDLKEDSLPLRILPELIKRFPENKFEIKDPNEEWEPPDKLVVIDTVIGIKNVKVFDNFEKFSATPNITMHDFDALSNLRFLQKLGKIRNLKIIGLPPEANEKEVIKKACAALRQR